MNTFLNIGIAFFVINIIPNAKTGIVTKNIAGKVGLIAKLIATEKISINGLRIAVRINIINDICTLVTSVVSLVTRDEELNLSIALKLQDALTAEGAVVHMTRTKHETDKSNIDRAVFGNECNADISVKIHADGSDNPNVSGVSILVPGEQYVGTDVAEKSSVAAKLILDKIIKVTGANNRGISVRNDMTGFNWSEIPVLIIEVGFMTNPAEDALLETGDYQNKIVSAITDGLKMYFEN